MSNPASVHPVDPAFAAQSRYTREEYERQYAESVRDPDGFWGRIAQRLDWFKPPSKISNVSYDLGDFRIKWYEDGELNASVSCLDRHLASRGDKPAIVFEPDDPATPAETITYRQLHARVCKLARSDPAAGSLYPWHQRISPRRVFSTKRTLCSSLPFSRRVGTSMLGPWPMISNGAAARLNSSTRIVAFSGSEGCSLPP